ncbi:hypothetical protein [Streptomyces sp. NPDC088146]|uniref:hypothetical protein n=1 Tax=Streptomyces sp. NPDC088146 TaxID=3365829 RepID=UPI003809C579
MAEIEQPHEGAALAALRRWARDQAHARPRLVANAWRAGARNVAALAREAKVTRDTIYADLRAHGIDPTDPQQKKEPAMPADTTVVARYLTVAGESLNDPSLAVDVTLYSDPDWARSENEARVICPCGFNTPLWAQPSGRKYDLAEPDQAAAARAEAREQITAEGRELAQSHAETCRAMPAPAV